MARSYKGSIDARLGDAVTSANGGKVGRRQVSVLVAHPSADLYGADKVLLETVEGLLRHGMRVLVTVPAWGPLVPELEARGAAVVLCPTPVLRRSLLSPSGALRLFGASVRGGLAGTALIRSSRPDVILANTSTVPLWTILGRLCRVPVVTHVHEAEAYASRLLRGLLALPVVLSSDVITNSRFTAQTLARSLPWLQNRATVIYNGVPGPLRVYPARSQLNGALRILYIGRLSHRKGVDVVLDAVIRLRQLGHSAYLDIVGAAVTGADDYETALRTCVAAHDADAYVTFHGYQHEIWPFLEATDVAVVPSRLDESFGNTAVEAFLAARPLVASGVSGLKEAAGDYASVQFVEPGSVAALVAALETVIADWGRLSAAAVEDAAQARARHSPEVYGEGMSRFILEAAGQA